MNSDDMHFISGDFFYYPIPKDKLYLLHYFSNDLQLTFLRYYLAFGSYKNFVDHTGYYCCDRLLKRLKARYNRLVYIYDKAKKSLTEEGMEAILHIENGKMHVSGEKHFETIKKWKCFIGEDYENYKFT